jgi:predicted metal-binding protein
MELPMTKDLDNLLSDLRSIHPDIKPISADIIVVADWVRFKCRYGCRAYGKHLCCPPYAPTPEEMRKVVAEYKTAILARFETAPGPGADPKHTHHYFWNSVTHLHKTVYELEKRAFLSGYYKALGFYAMPCTLCETCVVEEKLEKGEEVSPLEPLRCRHKDMMRPSMEACGVDVFKTLENAGYSPQVLKSYSDSVVLFGMVLLE